MQALAMFLGMSVSFAGVGGLISGVFARSFGRAMLWAAGFGVLEVVLLFIVSPISRFAPGFVLVGLFWGLVGWLVGGRFLARRRAAKAATADPSQ
jgi:hypothetical protein